MLAEWSVELGVDDSRLEIPWSSEDGQTRFFDLKRQPELLLEIPEGCFYPELAEFLSWANSSDSPIETAKCDAWTSRQINPEEEIFGEACKFGSYIDLLVSRIESRGRFAENESLVQALAKLLRYAPEMSSAAEFIVRRCSDRRVDSHNGEDSFYITFYLHGYGEDESQARQRWGIALKMVQNAMIQHFSARTNAAR